MRILYIFSGRLDRLNWIALCAFQVCKCDSNYASFAV